MGRKQKSKSCHHLPLLGCFLFLIAAYSLYGYPKLLSSSLSSPSSSSTYADILQQHKTDHKSPSATFNTQSTIIPYSPCHYPVSSESTPHYKLGEEALMTCIDSLKKAATDAATKWPRDLVSSSLTNNLNGKGKYYKTQIINYILPTWLCPTEERIGGFADGAKWICAPRLFLNKYEPCYVYSFGSNANFEFENALSVINSQCQTHTFDPTPKLVKVIENMTLPKQYTFHFEAFGGKDSAEVVIGGQTFKTKTLDQFVTEFQTPYIDILKIDVDGAELNGIYSTDKDSIWMQNKIGQILIEIHINFDNTDTFRRLFDLFDFILSRGFVLFHSEWNVYHLPAWEFAFINLDFKKPTSDVTYMERLLTDPLITNGQIDTHLSDVAAQIKFFHRTTKYYYNSLQLAFSLPEATYHCRNKIFVGDRTDFYKYFMFLCMDTLHLASTFTGIYESHAIQEKSSAVEESLKNSQPSSLLFEEVTTTISPSSSNVSDRHTLIGQALQKYDVVKIDLSKMLSTLSMLDHVDTLVLLSQSQAKVIHIEFHICDHVYLDAHDRFLNLIETFQNYEYEIYHKEVTFTENLKGEEAGLSTDVCHVAISWIKR